MSRSLSRLFSKYTCTSTSTPSIISSSTIFLTPYISASMTANKPDVDVKSVTPNNPDHDANMDHPNRSSTLATGALQQDNTPPVVGGEVDPNTSFPTVKKPRRRKKAAGGEVLYKPASQFFLPGPSNPSTLSIRAKNPQTSRLQSSVSAFPYNSRQSIVDNRLRSVQSKKDYSTDNTPLTRSQRNALKNGPQAVEDDDYIPPESTQPQPHQAVKGQAIGDFFSSNTPKVPPPDDAMARKQKKRAAKREAKGQQDPSAPKQPPPANPPKPTNGRYGDAKRNMLLKPIPDPAYLSNINHGYQLHLDSHPLLVILDLNGVLVHRRKGSKTGFVPRLDLEPFLAYLFANHHVMIWSSGMPSNVVQICQRVLSPPQYDALIAIWARDTLRLSAAAFGHNVQVYKQLSWVWTSAELQAKAAVETAFGAPAVGVYAQRNTVLIDDSEEKALAEPWNLLKVDEFLGNEEGVEGGEGVLMRVVDYLEQLKWASDASAFMHKHPFSGWKRSEV